MKNRIWVFGAIAVLSLGVLGAGLKYLEEDAKRVSSPTVRGGSLLDAINPFLAAPPPMPTPQLAKEYIYAGEKAVGGRRRECKRRSACELGGLVAIDRHLVCSRRNRLAAGELAEQASFNLSSDGRQFAIGMGSWKHEVVLLRGLRR